jgi:hypothetical protein
VARLRLSSVPRLSWLASIQDSTPEPRHTNPPMLLFLSSPHCIGARIGPALAGRFFANTVNVTICENPSPDAKPVFHLYISWRRYSRWAENAPNSLLSVLAQYGQTPHTVFAQGR